MTNKNNLLEKEWVFHGKWKEKPLTVSYWISNKKSAKKEYQEYNSFVVDLIYLDGNYYLPKDQSISINNVTKELIESDVSFFKKLFLNIEKVLGRYQKLADGKKDMKKFLDFLNETIELHFFWNILSQLNVGITSYLIEKSKEFGNINYLDYIVVSKDTILMKEKREFEKLYFLFKREDQKFKKAFDDYFKEYEFLGTHCFSGTPQTKESIIKRLKSFEPKKEKSKLLREENDKFSRIHNEILNIASDVSYYRICTVEIFDKISYMFWSNLHLIAKKYNSDFDKITHYSYTELIDIIQAGKEIEDDLIGQRIKLFGFVMEKDRLRFLEADEIGKLMKKLSEKKISVNLLKGNTAYKGYVKGIAKIILSPEELSKIKEGDILVSYETTPDYVPAMGKSKAIVTELGGITSHAAIVSREMQKPCIVGVKDITKVLKDGNFIEVDANKGTVRKIK